MRAAWSYVRGRVDSWYFGYAVAAVLVNAFVPMFMPVSVKAVYPDNAVAVGSVTAVFYFGQVIGSPLVGKLADRLGIQRGLFLWSFPAMAATAVGFAFSENLFTLIMSSFLAGLAASMTLTSASTFVIESHPRSEWNERMGWFRFIFAIGQIVGLGITSLFSDEATRLRTIGWLIGAAIILVFGPTLGRIGLPHLTRVTTAVRDRARETESVIEMMKDAAADGVGGAAGSATAASVPDGGAVRAPSTPDHVLVAQPDSTAATLHARAAREGTQAGAAPGRRRSAMWSELAGPFGIFLLAWFLACFALQSILNTQTLVMADTFGVSHSTASTFYLVGSIIGMCLYPVSGFLAKRIGSGYVLGIGMCVIVVAYALVTAVHYLHLPGPHFWGPLGSTLLGVSYPFLYIGGALTAARLNRDTEGGAMGLFYSSMCVAATIACIVPSFLAQAAGYITLVPLAGAVMVIGLLVSIPVVWRHQDRLRRD